MVAHINPYLDSSFENEADSDTMPEFAYRLETEKCRKFQITTELLSGKPLDKQVMLQNNFGPSAIVLEERNNLFYFATQDKIVLSTGTERVDCIVCGNPRISR